MAAWYILSALGFYPLCPGKPEYILGAPLFPHAVVYPERWKENRDRSTPERARDPIRFPCNGE